MARITTYPPKVDVEGAFFKLVPNGFTFEHAGCTFKEYESTDGKKTRLIGGELVGADDGKPRWLMQSFKNWALMAHNADTMLRMTRKYNESAKERRQGALADLKNQAATLKGAGLTTVEISAILKTRGNAEADIAEACKAE